MRYGLGLDTSRPISGIIDDTNKAVSDGFDMVFASNIFGYDALTLLAVVGSHVPGIELATAVVPTYPRHPIMMAQQALTVQAATGGRLTLGIGLSHQIVIEGLHGYSYEKPARHMREYLSALMPMLNGEQVAFEGETLKAVTIGPLDVEAPAPDVLVAALGTVMLKLTGKMADGTITWMTGPATLESHIIPTITAAADDAGKKPPRIVATFPVCVTDDADAARTLAAQLFAIYDTLPSYKAMLDKEGVPGPGGVAIVGDEASVRDQILHLESIGVTDFGGGAYGSPEEVSRTMAVFCGLANA